MQRLVVCKALIGCLGFGLRVELNEDGANECAFAPTKFVLHSVDCGNQALKLRSAPIDCIDFFADEKFEPVGRSLLWRDPTCSHGARFTINTIRRGSFFVFAVGPFFHRLGSSFDRSLDKLGLGGFKLHRDLVSLFNDLFNLFAIIGDPEILYLLSKHASELALIQVVLGYRVDQYCASRHAIGVQRRQEIGLTQIDEVDALAHDHVENKSWRVLELRAVLSCCDVLTEVDPGYESVCVVAVFLVLDIAKGDEVQLLLPPIGGRINGEQDGPSDQATKETQGH